MTVLELSKLFYTYSEESWETFRFNELQPKLNTPEVKEALESMSTEEIQEAYRIAKAGMMEEVYKKGDKAWNSSGDSTNEYIRGEFYGHFSKTKTRLNEIEELIINKEITDIKKLEREERLAKIAEVSQKYGFVSQEEMLDETISHAKASYLNQGDRNWYRNKDDVVKEVTKKINYYDESRKYNSSSVHIAEHFIGHEASGKDCIRYYINKIRSGQFDEDFLITINNLINEKATTMMPGNPMTLIGTVNFISNSPEEFFIKYTDGYSTSYILDLAINSYYLPVVQFQNSVILGMLPEGITKNSPNYQEEITKIRQKIGMREPLEILADKFNFDIKVHMHTKVGRFGTNQESPYIQKTTEVMIEKMKKSILNRYGFNPEDNISSLEYTQERIKQIEEEAKREQERIRLADEAKQKEIFDAQERVRLQEEQELEEKKQQALLEQQKANKEALEEAQRQYAQQSSFKRFTNKLFGKAPQWDKTAAALENGEVDPAEVSDMYSQGSNRL